MPLTFLRYEMATQDMLHRKIRLRFRLKIIIRIRK